MDTPVVAHLIDYLNPETPSWFHLLIKNLGHENYILPEKYDIHDDFHAHDENVIYAKFVNKKLSGFLARALNPIIKQIRFIFLKNVLRKINANIIHAHFAHIGWEAIKLKETLKLPLVVSFYGYDYQSVPFKYPVWKKRYEALFQEVDKIICEGNNGKKILIDMGCHESKIEVCKLGIETKSIPVKKRFKSTDSLRIVQIANMVHKKGHAFTILAFAEALKSCPNMHLTLIGNGAIKQKVVELIKLNNLSEFITIIDKIDYTSLHNILNDYDVFIHPSCYSDDMDCEGGAPIVLLDAQATGLPIISTKHCDIPDEVSHNKSGYLAEEKNVEELADFIVKFYNMSQDEYASFSENARNHVVENYDILKNANEFDSVYNKILVDSI